VVSLDRFKLDPDCLHAFLSGYVYSDRVGVHTQNAEDFLRIAEVFQVPRLRAICQQKLNMNINFIKGQIPPASLVKDMQSLVNDSIHSDVSFEIESKIVPAHKVVLASRSEYFRALWQQDLWQWHDGGSGKILVDDIGYDGFLALLTFIYSGHLEINGDIAVELMTKANEYSLFTLKTRCERFISKQIDSDNVYDLLGVSEMLDARFLESRCLQFVAMNIQHLKQSESFSSLSAKRKNDLQNYLPASKTMPTETPKTTKAAKT